MWWLVLTQHALACDKQPVHVEVPAAGVSALAIQGWTGNVSLVPANGDAVVFDGTACGEVRLRARAQGARMVARAAIAPQAALVLKVGVPAGVRSVTFVDHNGPMKAEQVDADVAVISSFGSIAVDHGGSLRIAYTEGDLKVESLARDLVVDRLVGTVQARGVRGNAIVERVTGDVDVQDIDGNLAVSGGDGDVRHAEVRGAVTVQ